VGLDRDTAPANTTLDAARLSELGLAAPAVSDTIDAMIEGVIHE
jgi:hypothetical protein